MPGFLGHGLFLFPSPRSYERRGRSRLVERPAGLGHPRHCRTTTRRCAYYDERFNLNVSFFDGPRRMAAHRAPHLKNRGNHEHCAG
jgi:hypothetical protein